MPDKKDKPEKKRVPGSGHRDRMRRRFSESYTLYHFSDEEALEMLLFYALPKQDTAATAAQLIASFGSLSGVLDAPMESLCAVPGIGNYTALYLKLLKATVSKYRSSKFRSFPVVNQDFNLGA